MSIKLELGKKYVTANGSIGKVVRIIEHHTYPYEVVFISVSGDDNKLEFPLISSINEVYTVDGKWVQSKTNTRDLIAEYAEEREPRSVENTTTQHNPGVKLDNGKNRVGLVLNDFALALLEVSKVGTFGANKYTDHGWLSVENGIDRYTDAMLRHHFDESSGISHDSESELLHAAHRAWNALAILELMLQKEK